MQPQGGSIRDLITIFDEISEIFTILNNSQANDYTNASRRVAKSNSIENLPDGPAGVAREFLRTGRSTELEKLRKLPKIRAYKDFDKIMGVGPATISRWLAAGILGLPHLRREIGAGRVTLNHMQKLGLAYYQDLNTRIPRAEVELIAAEMRALLITLSPGLIFDIAGSYRRGKPDSGDIDILISNPQHFDDELMANFVSLVAAEPNFVDVIVAGPERVTILYKHKLVRQIDILYVAYGSYFAALNYFTGGFIHNEKIRGIAKKMGYRLNQAGLYKLRPYTLIPIKSEEEIYKILGIPYIPPNMRE